MKININSIISILTLVIICIIGFFYFFGAVDKNDAYSVLQKNGYTDIEITGRNIFACEKSDFYRTGFIAKSPNGQTVKGTVCKGLLFKGNTIRFD